MKKLFAFILLAFIATIAQAVTTTQFVTFTNTVANQDQPYPESIARKGTDLYLPLTFGRVVNKVDKFGTVTEFAVIPDDYLLGTTFDNDGNLMVVAGGTGIWKVTTWGAVYKYSNVTGMGTINDIVCDRQGNFYVTDDTNNVIWKVLPFGFAYVWSADPLFDVVNHDNFPWDEGCNGIAISGDGKKIYVTNTSDGIVIEIGIKNNGDAEPGVVFAQSDLLVGADGIKERNGNIFVVNNLDNSVLKVKSDGSIITLSSGSPLKFPTGIVFGKKSSELFIANNGDAFFSTTPSNQGVVKIDLND